ncbi:AAA family ATPase [Serratia marcescens]|jgi:predicted ATPase
MQEHMLEKFSIFGLNDESDVHLKFVDNLKVIVSENGFGKTTIISLLYSFLKNDKKISKFNFKSLSVKLHGEEEVVYPKEIIKILFEDDFPSAFKFVVRHLDQKTLKNYNRKLNFELSNSLMISLIIYFICNRHVTSKIDKGEMRRLIQKDLHIENEDLVPIIMNVKNLVESYSYYFDFENLKVNFSDLHDAVILICDNLYVDSKLTWDLQPFYDKMQALLINVNKFSKKEFIYLPTYRLVESSISSFKKEDDDEDEYPFGGLSEAKAFFKDNPLIQFGVDDIKDTWSMLTNRIRSSTTQDFLKLSGGLLKNIISNKKVNKRNISELIESKDSILKILSRIDSKTIDGKDKENLLSIIDRREFNPTNNNNSLFYILENMVTIYNNQKHIDEAIAKYKNVVNEFFNDKAVIFNEITSEIYVEKKKGNKRIDIENLSSGEKQILSLFTKIYLAELDDLNRKYWIFYDEPEISLSIEWQQMLLPKIIESDRCEFLMAATHSPFIFKNNLKPYTSDLALEVMELQ